MRFRAGLMVVPGVLLVAGCGTPIYSSSPSLGPTAPASVPVASVAATPAPTPSPTTAGNETAEAFFAQFGAVPPPFHVRLASTLTGFPSGSAVEEADVDGRSYSAQLHVELEGIAPHDSQVVYVNGTGFVADAGTDEWQAYPDYDTVPPVNPFVDLDQAQWQDMGPDANTGGLERLHSTTWRLPADSASASRLTNVAFDLWLDESGMPLSAELTFQLTGATPATGVGYTASYEFSRIGEPVTIVAPIEIESASPAPSL